MQCAHCQKTKETVVKLVEEIQTIQEDANKKNLDFIDRIIPKLERAAQKETLAQLLEALKPVFLKMPPDLQKEYREIVDQLVAQIEK